MDRSLLCARTNSSFRYHERITHAIRYFEQHVELPVSLHLFAKQCRVSQYHFHRVFHKLFGEPLGKHVRRSRLELAARHLIYSDQTVDAIAQMVGYKSPTVFSRAFKRHFRIAPREYRASKRVLRNGVKIDGEFGHGALIPAGYRTMDGIHVVCVRRSGSYSIAAAEAWDILEKQEQLKPFFAAHPQRIALLYDPPEITPESYRRVLKHDAEESMCNGDYRKSLIELAMCCETFLRYCVLASLPKELDKNIVNSIEELNINQYVTKHFKSLLSTEPDIKEYKKISEELSSLFNKRNKMLHMGNIEGATKKNCERFLEVAKKLISLRKDQQDYSLLRC